MPPPAPKLPDRYEVTGHVASGGMAAVYAARDGLLGREVAVKVLAEHLNEEPSARVRFQREARAAATLSSHPHVVTIYDVGEHEGRSFIVMELLKRGSLAAVLRSGQRVERATALRWLRDAASALDAAHAAGIVHRDIKPANLLLDDRGGIAIADFGIARLAESDQVTQTGQVLGTAAYLSPEQALGETATAASDIYALTVVAFELLTGRRPFVVEGFAAQARAHLEEQPPVASEVSGDLPSGLDDALDRGLAKEPAQRWPTAMALVEALERPLEEDEEEPTRIMSAPLTRTVPAPAAASPRVDPEPEPSRPAIRQAPLYGEAPTKGRSRRLAPVLAVLALLAVAGAAFAAFAGGGGSGDENRSTTPERAERTATPTPKATDTPTPEATETEKEEETATPTPTATPTAAATATPSPSGTPAGSARSLNDQGFTLIRQERWEEAIPPLAQSVALCGDRTDLDPCGFALFNLGQALNRAGRSQEAIPYLERRLEISNNQRGVVRAELARARASGGG